MNAIPDVDHSPMRAPSPTDATADTTGVDRRPRAAWSLARTIVTVVFCTNGLVELLDVWQGERTVGSLVVAAILMAAMLTIQLFHFSRPGADLRSRRSYVLLGVLILLAYVPLLWYRFDWISLPPFVAGCVLLVMRPVAAWTSFGVVMISILGIRLALEAPNGTGAYSSLAYGMVNAAIFAILVYLLTRLAGLVAELHAARDEIARYAVAEERLRFARDLHDLLGLSLSAITLKGELINRLLNRYPERAMRELREILDIARRALADVRATSKGYRELSLDQEINSAESVLRGSDIEVRVERGHTDLPPRVRALLGAVLREGVTNVLRHSAAGHCDISIRQAGGLAYLEMLNDGVIDEPTAEDLAAGNGVRTVADRVAAVQGRVDAEVLPDGRFRLAAQVPVRAGGRRLAGRALGQVTRRSSGGRTTTLPLNARLILVLVAVAFTLSVASTVIHVLLASDDVRVTAPSIAYLVALLALQVGYFSHPTARLRSRTGYTLLFVQACLVYVPLVELGNDRWISLPGWVAGNALLILPPAGGWLVFAGTIGGTIFSHVLSTGQPLDIAFYTASVLLSGATAYGLTWLTKLIAELDDTRKRLASLAVAEERLRFARDLHDLLGLSLSAMTLKTELTLRLVDAAPDQAATELGEILDLARQALADVRSVASGYRELSLDQESESAESVLGAADIDVRMDMRHDGLPVRVGTVLAVVLREGVTNVLRHSAARRCDITICQGTDEVCLVITNDNPATGPVTDHGSGTRNLTERVVKLGGELRSGSTGDGRYELKVSLPL
jgi:signal transduction histidine kinase